MRTIHVRGTHGLIEVCAHTGQMMTPYSQIPGPYRTYSSADVVELAIWHEESGVPLTVEVPMTCVTLRRYDGMTEPACITSREEWVYRLNHPELLAA